VKSVVKVWRYRIASARIRDDAADWLGFGGSDGPQPRIVSLESRESVIVWIGGLFLLMTNTRVSFILIIVHPHMLTRLILKAKNHVMVE
jgi:hypothetical protein